jgi:transposase
MMGEKRFTPKQVYQLDWERRIPSDHLLRQVTEVVDFAFVRRLAARFYSHTGKPSIDPVVLVKMALLGYLYGITSERRLAEEVRLNLAFLWFLGYDLDEPTPDHSVLSKARRRFGVTVYQAFFAEIVRQCQQAGLVAGDRLFIDSTLVEANADDAALRSRALLEQRGDVEAYLAALWRDNPPPEGEPLPTVAATPGLAVEAAEPAPDQRPHALGPDDRPNTVAEPVNVVVASRTDPDAGLVSRPGVPLGLYHKLHVGIDGGRARLITAVEVTPGEVPDADLLDRLWREHVGMTGCCLREVVADATYGTYATYRLLEGQRIRASIPILGSAWDRRALPSTRFRYDQDADCYWCPAGQRLKRQGFSRTARVGGGVIYRALPAACGACAQKTACCGTAKARTIVRPIHDDGLLERAGAHLRTRQARRSIRQRKCWAETVMAELKERHGVRRARSRGHDPVLIQALFAAMAYTIKKLVRARRPRPQPIAVALRAGASAPPRPSGPVYSSGRRPRWLPGGGLLGGPLL